ncbi:twin-arginine translocase subunit TatC [Leadbetterella sp. DM7]|uniref:twin-arginine translocase subunit TatC n=1 Tax=Leadbetterella sp. DM7 TaxID=3235085 RepID=UPI00349EBFE7
MPLDQAHVEEEEFDGEKEMTFLEHLEELRWHLIRSIAAIFIFMIVAWFIKEWVYGSIIMGPSKVDFWTYRKMCEIGRLLHIDSLCLQELKFDVQNREISGQFMLAITSSAIIGLLIAFPYVIWEIWSFIKPGLRASEKRAARGAVLIISLLFFSGVLFGYYIVTPFAVHFMVNFQLDPSIVNQYDIKNYLSILTTLTLACGLMFQLPVVIMVLTKIGIVTPSFLKEYRRHAFVVILIVAAVITPSPDMISQILVAIPLYFLFEVSILVSNRIYKDNLKQLEDEHI